MAMKSLLLISAILCGVIRSAAVPGPSAPGPLGSAVKQLILSVAPDWSSKQGALQRFERATDGHWIKVGEAIPVLYGKQGLAWGRGTRRNEEPGLHKREGDGGTPAAMFALGIIYGNDPSLPEGADFPYHQVTSI